MHNTMRHVREMAVALAVTVALCMLLGGGQALASPQQYTGTVTPDYTLCSVQNANTISSGSVSVSGGIAYVYL